jgi:hypothetical protein
MSTDYRPLPDILFAQLFDGRPEKYGVREKISARSTEVGRYLEGYDGVLLAYRAPDVLEAVRAIYDRDHSVTITLTEEDLAALGMVIARTDDLSKA